MRKQRRPSNETDAMHELSGDIAMSSNVEPIGAMVGSGSAENHRLGTSSFALALDSSTAAAAAGGAAEAAAAAMDLSTARQTRSAAQSQIKQRCRRCGEFGFRVE